MPQSVAKEFVAADKPGKLPARKKAKRAGLINQAVRVVRVARTTIDI
jgi:hypothetical protein